MAALTGAIGGACGVIGAGLGGIIGSQFTGALIGSASGGALSACVTGGNPLMGALTAMATTALVQGFDFQPIYEVNDELVLGVIGKEYTKQLAASAGAGALVGGLSAEIQGGDFQEGAKQGAVSGASGFVVSAAIQTYLFEEGIWDTEGLNPEGTDVRTNGAIGGEDIVFQLKTEGDVANLGAVYANPSQGLVNDLLQLTLQTVFLGYGDSLAAGLANHVNAYQSGIGRPVTVNGHSQGTATAANAALAHGMKVQQINLLGSTTHRAVASLAGRVSGSNVSMPMHPQGDWAGLINGYPVSGLRGLANPGTHFRDEYIDAKMPW